MALATKLELDGFEVVLCPCDADTTIVKVALDSGNGTPVTVYSDVLCLLVHHVKVSTNPADIFVTNMTRLCYRIEDLISELDDMVLFYLLFTHAFTGCDTTSAVHKFGKNPIFVEIR